MFLNSIKVIANTIKTIPARNLLHVIGDCNAYIGTDDATFKYHEQTNSNGQLLLDMALENQHRNSKHAVSEAERKAVDIHCRHQRS